MSHHSEQDGAASGLPHGYVDPAAPPGDWLHAERPVRFRPLAFLARVVELWLIIFAAFALTSLGRDDTNWAFEIALSLGVVAIPAVGVLFWILLWGPRLWVLLDAESLRVGPNPRSVVNLAEVVEAERIEGWWPLLRARYRAIGRDRGPITPGPKAALALTQQGASWHNTHFLVFTYHPDAFQRAVEGAVARAQRRRQAGPAVLSDEAPPWLRDQAHGEAGSGPPPSGERGS